MPYNSDLRAYISGERLVRLDRLNQEAPTVDLDDGLVAIDFDNSRAILRWITCLHLRFALRGERKKTGHGNCDCHPATGGGGSEMTVHECDDNDPC